jgi:uncharacterized protein YceK
MRIREIIAMTAAVSLGGCGAVNTMASEYGDVPVASVRISGQSYHVLDKPADGKMLVTAGTSGVLSRGDTPQQAAYEAAGLQYLVESGRGVCRVVEASELIQSQYQVSYDCSPIVPPVAAKHKRARS